MQSFTHPHAMPTKTPDERAEGVLWRRLAITVAVHIWAIGFFGFGLMKLADTAAVRVATVTQEAFVAKPRGMASRASMQMAEARN